MWPWGGGHVFNNGNFSNRVRVDTVDVYVMAPYGFDDLGPEPDYRGHANKKQFGVVVGGGHWLDEATYKGEDMLAKNAPLRVITRSLFRQWRDVHNKGGDMLVFSDRKSLYIAPIEVIVPLKTPEDYWYDYQKEAEAIVAPGGVLIADAQARNRAINAAYAKLWLQDTRLQWAGLAAFASKQVGCGMAHASELVAQGPARMDAISRTPFGAGEVDSVSMTVAASSAFVHEQLALGNTTLFLDVYPLHRFFQDYGARNLREFIDHRQNIIRRSILWPVGQDKVQFGLKRTQVTDAFDAIAAGNVAKSVHYLADHEQRNILQPGMYANPMFHKAMRANQVSFVMGFPSGIAEAVQLTLASQCQPLSDERTVNFSNDFFADLANVDVRMAFVLRAAQRFDNLLRSPASRGQIIQSLQIIAAGGGVR